MQLYYHRTGEGSALPPLIILHGLFGTWENWRAQIKLFAEQFDVIAVDLRNHGLSPHSEAIDYALMATDVLELMERLQIERCALLGHSMGGKVAMQLALEQPHRVARLVVVDVAPVAYEHHHRDTFAGLFAVDPGQVSSRRDADLQLQAHIDDASVRAFLLKNLYRNESGQFAWRMNLPALHDQYDNISAAPPASLEPEARYSGPVLFIKGGNSIYLQPEYQETILRLFPAARVKIIAGCGHWPHAEKPELFNKLVMRFLATAD